VGTQFGNLSGRVYFGNARASLRGWTDKQILLFVPNGQGEVKVVVQRESGERSEGVDFKYIASPTPTPTPIAGEYRVFANNDLGMHCVDKDFSIFSLLPPYNVVNAQVLQVGTLGKPKLLDASSVEVQYSAVADPSGSVNSTSFDKTNFWDFAPALFGVNLYPGQGLKGLFMPGDAPIGFLSPTALSWNTQHRYFAAEGIPILPWDDAGVTKRYPLLRITATDKQTGRQLAHVDTVVPVSEETTCYNCHATGKVAASAAGVAWAQDTNMDVQFRKNILTLHDLKNGTDLVNNKPVLCASCHYSPALDLAGAGPGGSQVGHATMSSVMHSFHADKMLDANGVALNDVAVPTGGLPPSSQRQSCYQCHPGADTKCLRGAMSDAVTCQNCHGGMAAVGGRFPLKIGGSLDGTNDGKSRRPWQDLPRCQSCHTGDAVNHLGAPYQLAQDGIRLQQAFEPKDPAASPLLASNKRFAEEPNKLFRFSKGHGGITCEGCHGSTHAIWPGSPGSNDNIPANQLQGHSGVIGECSTCHAQNSLMLTSSGPHGMHNVNDARWVNGHESWYRQNPTQCKTCHGTDLKGTVLSRAMADRTFKVDGQSIAFAKGAKIGCFSCHNGP